MNKEKIDEVMSSSRQIFLKKMADYGDSWRILRLTSIVDQMFIKAARISSILEAGEQKVNDHIDDDYMGLLNYSIIGLISNDYKDKTTLSYSQIEEYYGIFSDIISSGCESFLSSMNYESMSCNASFVEKLIRNMSLGLYDKINYFKEKEDNGCSHEDYYEFFKDMGVVSVQCLSFK